MKIQFENISQFDQLGVEPGKSGEAEVTKEEAERLVARGAIKTGDLPQEETPEPVEGKVPEDERTQEEIDAAEEEARAQDRENAEAAAKQQSGGRRGRS